jgi:hypothetical protein
MPEATMNEYERFVHRQDDIRLARESRIMNTKSKSFLVECASENQFGLRIFPANARHDSGAGLLIYDIGHGHPLFRVKRSSGV